MSGLVEWSASKINFFNYCRRRGFLKYELHDGQLLFSSYRRGSLVHELTQHFWERLGIPSEIKRNKNGKIISEKKYSNAEEFVEHAQGQWQRIVIKDEIAGREIVWGYPRERWIINNSYLPSICALLFKRLVRRSSPIDSEVEFDFVLDGIRFTGKIDEVRFRKIIDYKTEYPWVKEGGMKLTGNPQLTLYGVGLCALCYKDEDFARRVGLYRDRKKFMGNPLFVSPKIDLELFMIGALPILAKPKKEKTEREKELKLIYQTGRTDRDFYELLSFIKDVQEQVDRFRGGQTREIPATERGKKCDYCDMRKSCMIRLEEELGAVRGGILKDKNGQMHFNYVAPYSHKHPKPRKSRQRRFQWKRRAKSKEF